MHPVSSLKRAGLLALMCVLALNIFTGSPLLALWIGSRVQGDAAPSMAAFFTFFGTMAAVSWTLVVALGLTSRAYDSLTGRHQTVRAHLPWLRSLRGERPGRWGRRSGSRRST